MTANITPIHSSSFQESVLDSQFPKARPYDVCMKMATVLAKALGSERPLLDDYTLGSLKGKSFSGRNFKASQYDGVKPEVISVAKEG